jgi:hypothetical protein
LGIGRLRRDVRGNLSVGKGRWKFVFYLASWVVIRTPCAGDYFSDIP